MKIKKRNKPDSIESIKKKHKLTIPEIEALTKAGLDVSGILYLCRGDLGNDGQFVDTWTLFDEKGVYYAEGKQTIEKSKHKRSKKPEIEVEISFLSSCPIQDIDRIECEQYISTGRLITIKDDIYRPLTRFSVGALKEFDNFTKAFNSYKNTGTVSLPPELEEENKCKVCGAPTDPGKFYCKKHGKSSATAVRLFQFFGGYVPQIAVILFFMLAESAVSVFLPQISTRTLFDNVLGNPNGDTTDTLIASLGTLILTIFGMNLLMILLRVIQQYVTASVIPNVTYDIKVKIFAAMQRLSLSFYSSKQTGSLMERVTRDTTNIYWFFIEGIPQIIFDVASIIGIVTIMFIMDWRLSLVVIIALPIIMALLIAGGGLFRGLHHRSWLFSSKVSSMVSDNINGQRIIKAFSKEDDEYARFHKVSDDFRGAELKLGLLEATLIPSLELIVLLLSSVVLGVGGVMVAKDQLTTGKLLSFVVYLGMLREPFEFLSWVSNWWSRCADSAQRVFEICDSEAEIKEIENPVSMEQMHGDIEINELDFEYEPARPVIKQLNLKVRAGEMLGIVGKTGAGKTTIANLIARLYDAKNGDIRIDGVDVKNIRLRDLRNNIGVVSQDIYLFMGTVADNIRYAKPDAPMSEVIAAAKAASAHDFIMKLPDAYETRIGSGGRKLSGGETQRISIARTIIQNPKILILDEATAAMDTETERNIQNAVSKLKKGRTTLAIAHRLSTLRDADRLAVIEDGTIVESGTFRELLQLKGEFYKQYKIQSDALRTAGILESD